MKKLLAIMALCLVCSTATWADETDEETASVKAETTELTAVEEADAAAELAATAEMSFMEFTKDPMKKRWKYMVANQDDLGTEEAIQLKNWLDKAGHKQMKRGNILFWSSLLWPVACAVAVSAIGVEDDNAGERTAIAVAGVSVFCGQMVWGLLETNSARKKLDQSRLIIVQAPLPGVTFGNENYMAQLGMGVMRDAVSHDVGLGPSLRISF